MSLVPTIPNAQSHQLHFEYIRFQTRKSEIMGGNVQQIGKVCAE